LLHCFDKALQYQSSQQEIEMNAEQIAKIFGCTVEQAKAQYKANGEQLRKMESKAKATGKKVNGYAQERLAAYAKQMEECSK
jgi:ABC-type enterochelin transport system substrate-binding protein